MKQTKKLWAILIAAVLLLSAFACSKPAEKPAEPTAAPVQPAEKTDEELAAECAALIDAIYVQERTDETDAQCAAAKAAWDALTDAQKELVAGEEADPDYFGRDTGDASKDDPKNADGIGENELLVVSFGTSFNDSRAEDIGGIEAALQAAYPDWSVRRAFTAQIIINHVQARDGEFIDNMDQALERAVANGVKNLVIQPTHLMQGAEYDELCEAVKKYEDKFESVQVALPLLGEVGTDATVVNTDKGVVAKAITAEAVKAAGYESLEAAEADGVAFVFMGHGTSHTAKVSYTQIQNMMNTLGYRNVFIGTVEGKPEETACEEVIKTVNAAGYTKVILRPLMVVAGDHANNDMADPEDPESWYSMFNASGLFTEITCQIEGLGRIADVQALYVAHAGAALKQVEGIKLVDMKGHEVTLKKPAERIVALTASDCEIVFALGAGDLLVGRGEYCDYPAEVFAIPSVESGGNTNIEQILALNPDVVVMSSMAQTEEQVKQLEDAGVAVVVSDAQDIEGVYTAIELLGGLLGKDAEADKIISDMKAGFAEIEANKLDGTQTVYFEVSPLQWGLWTAGTGTFMNEIAEMVGLRNCFSDLSGWAQISEEQVLERNPDYIVTITMYWGEGPTPEEEIMSRPGWENITAVQNGAILNLQNNELSRPIPRLADGAKMLYDFVMEKMAALQPAA